jgi:hypothetical protein
MPLLRVGFREFYAEYLCASSMRICGGMRRISVRILFAHQTPVVYSGHIGNIL